MNVLIDTTGTEEALAHAHSESTRKLFLAVKTLGSSLESALWQFVHVSRGL